MPEHRQTKKTTTTHHCTNSERLHGESSIRQTTMTAKKKSTPRCNAYSACVSFLPQLTKADVNVLLHGSAMVSVNKGGGRPPPIKKGGQILDDNDEEDDTFVEKKKQQRNRRGRKKSKLPISHLHHQYPGPQKNETATVSVFEVCCEEKEEEECIMPAALWLRRRR